MRKVLMLGAVLAAVAFPMASHAQFTLGARLGYGVAMGDAEKDVALNDEVTGQIPFQVDVMYRLSPQIALGLYTSYGFGMLNSDVSDSCDLQGVDCSASSLRFGIQGQYTFTSLSPTFVPWAGVGLGYEWLTQTASFSGVSASTDTTGWEYVNLQVGGDYKVNPMFSFGPYLMYALGEYTSVEGTDIPETAMHQWLSFGVRGKFDFGAQ